MNVNARSRLAIVAGLCLPLVVHAFGEEGTRLEPGATVERKLAAEQVHHYQLGLAAGEYAAVTLEQLGIDVVARLYRPDGALIAQFDFESSDHGTETVEIVAEASGNYILDVSPTLKRAPAARYTIRLNEKRPASDQDRSRFESIALLAQASLSYDSSEFDRALPAAERAAQTFGQVSGTESPDYARAIHLLANIYFGKRNYAQAERLYQQALAIRERTLASEHPDIAESCYDMARFYAAGSDASQADAFAVRALTIRERTLNADHVLIGRALTMYARTLFNTQQNVKAEEMFRRAMSVLERASGEDSTPYVEALHGLGYLYDTVGDFDRAEQLYRKEVASRERQFGKESLEVATALEYIARVNFRRAEYDEAEAIYQRVIDVRRRLHEDAGVLVTMGNLAAVTYGRGDYEHSEDLYKQVLAGWENRATPNRSWIARTLMHLGEVDNEKGDYAAAEQYLKRALSMVATSDPHALALTIQDGYLNFTADLLTALAGSYIGMRDYAAARPAARRALEIFEQVHGPNHPDNGAVLNQLGRIAYLKGDSAEAERLYFRARAVHEKTGAENTLESIATFNNLAEIYASRGDLAQALAVQSHANALDEHRLTLALTTGSERQKLNYLTASTSSIDRNVTLNVRHGATNPKMSELGATAVLRLKGRVLDAMTDTMAALRRRASPEDRALLDQLNETTTQVARRTLYASGTVLSAKDRAELEALEQKRERLEDEISRRSAEFRARQQPVVLDSIRRAVDPDAALIEFVVYRPLPTGGANGPTRPEPRYVAYVVRSQGDVRWAELGATNEIDEAVDALREALRDPRRTDVLQLARIVDRKVMLPVRSLIGNATHLLISPDGQLNLIPFETLVDEHQAPLIERYSITYLTSGRDLLRLQTPRASGSAPLIVTNPLFGEPQDVSRGTAAVKTSMTAQAARRSVTTGGDRSALYFAPLAGTNLEGRAIKTLFPEARVLAGPRATKSAVQRADAPLLLHLATHGFFLQNAEPSGPMSGPGNGTRAIRSKVAIQNPLLRSGLALSGANLPATESDDGIMTAMEASNLNLWGTKLVALSACDTGIGEVRNGEGVYGLRRAFVLAGAETVVMSLWPVSDIVTRELMTSYYTDLRGGLGRGEALRRTQLAMRKRRGREHPFYWASFILAGDWRTLDASR